MKLLGFLNLRGISGQIAALVLASIVAIHLILTTTFLINRPDQPDPSIDRGHNQLLAVAQLLGTSPAADRPQLFADIAKTFPQLEIEALPPDFVPAGDADNPELHSLRRRLGNNYRTFPLPKGEDTNKVGIALPDGAMISAKLLRPRPFWQGQWVLTLLFAVVSVTLLGLWAARALTAPLSSFAKAAEDFSLNGAAARTRPRRNSVGGQGAQPDAGAHHDPDRRPHQDAGRDQPRPAHADHPDAPARRIHRGRRAPQPDVARSRTDAVDAGGRALLPAQ
jgi:hypothetical protein